MHTNPHIRSLGVRWVMYLQFSYTLLIKVLSDVKFVPVRFNPNRECNYSNMNEVLRHGISTRYALTCPTAIVIAAAEVNPLITGYEMYSTTKPRLNTPSPSCTNPHRRLRATA